MKCLLLSSVVLLLFLDRVGAIVHYYMDNNCNGVLDISYIDQIRLKLTQKSYYSANMNCKLLLTSNLTDHLMLFFKDFDVESSATCNLDWLEVHDGDSINSPYVSGLSGKQCGSYINRSVRKTSSNNLFLYFRSDSSWQERGFDMVITRYHTGVCYDDEFSCSNGRCVSDGLVCNGYNPCGDYSDCSNDLAAGVIAGIVIGSFAFVLCASILITVRFRGVRRRRRMRQNGLHQPVNVVATTNDYGSGYNQPVPQQYPSMSYPTGQQYPNTQYPNQTYPN